ncbi:MAG: hypothetical protein ACLFV8_11935 [Alphaproteobacteria bacterium]
MPRWSVEGRRIIDDDGTIKRRPLDHGRFLPATRGSGLGSDDTFEQIEGLLNQVEIVLSGNSVTITDSGANGAHGSLTLFTCPLGLVQVFGAYASLTITAGDGGIADAAEVVAAIGTTATATDDASLTGTEADIVASTAMTLSGGTNGPTKLLSTDSETPAIFDGTSTAVAPKLNFAVPADDASDDDTLSVDGEILITWLAFGPHDL